VLLEALTVLMDRRVQLIHVLQVMIAMLMGQTETFSVSMVARLVVLRVPVHAVVQWHFLDLGVRATLMNVNCK